MIVTTYVELVGTRWTQTKSKIVVALESHLRKVSFLNSQPPGGAAYSRERDKKKVKMERAYELVEKGSQRQSVQEANERRLCGG